ncbi:MAG: lipase [Pseudomonadota bacterium]|jgi:abhydrolase domain-containing protein 6
MNDSTMTSNTTSRDPLVQQLHERPIEEQVLRQRWHLDAPWQSSGVLEPLTIVVGKLMYRQAMQHEGRLYGLKTYRTKIDGFQMYWLANAKPKKSRGTLLLLHGLSAEKAHWLRFARYFVKDYQVIIPDLPAHGQTGYQEGGDYSTARQAQRLLMLMDHLKIDRVHVVGNSMGGFIAARLACVAHQRLASLGLMDAAGLQARTNSVLEAALETGRNPFILHSLAEFDQFMSMAAVKLQWMPRQVRVMLAKQYSDRRERLFELFRQMQNEIYPDSWVENDIVRVKLPTLVLWGEQDRLLDVDMLAHFGELIPHAVTVKMAQTGHMPMMERPARTARHYRAFLKGL